MKAVIIKCLCQTVLLVFPLFAYSQTIDITITNIRSAKGQIYVSLFTNAEEFKTEKPVWERFYDKSTLQNNTFRVTVSDLKADTYGVVVHDDENGNGKMDYKFLGMPTEGFGFSDYIVKLLKRPAFKDFSFQLKENETKEVTVEMKYL